MPRTFDLASLAELKAELKADAVYEASFVGELLDEIVRLNMGEPKPKFPRAVALSTHHSREVRLVYTGTCFEIEKQWTDALGVPIWTNDDLDDHNNSGSRIDGDSPLYALIYALAFGQEVP